MDTNKYDSKLKVSYEDALLLVKCAIESTESTGYIYNNYSSGEVESISMTEYTKDKDENGYPKYNRIYSIILDIKDYTLQITSGTVSAEIKYHLDTPTFESLFDKAFIKLKGDAQSTLDAYLNRVKNEKS